MKQRAEHEPYYVLYDGDFGLTGLAAGSAEFERDEQLGADARAGEWFDATAEEVVRAVAVGDGALQAPGSAAAELLEDVLRLHASPLSDATLDTLWSAASDGAFRVGPDGPDGPDTRRRLEWIAAICRERLLETAPDHRPGTTPARADLAAEVLAELRDMTPELASRTVQPHGWTVPGAAAAGALEEVVVEVDPDLGFRLFLRILVVLGVPLGRERYARYQALGERFGYGEFHVSDVGGFVQDDL